MLEKLSTGFAEKIYSMLTSGNADINFFCNCIRMQNHEAATNSPINFALQLLKINIIYRTPILKKRLPSVKLGSDYLSDTFVRPPVCELATGVLDNHRIITDIFGSAVIIMKERDEIFKIVEEKTGISGFAKLRSRLDSSDVPIEDIYSKINERLSCRLDCNTELSVFEQFCFKNKYVTRLLDIAKCNGLTVTAYIKTSYPKGFIGELLDKLGIFPDELLISSENEAPVVDDAGFTGIVSSSFKKYIKPFIKKGCKPFYYPTPSSLIKRAKHPKIGKELSMRYDNICGLRVFNGLNRYSVIYERAYLCYAPAIFGFAQYAAKAALNRENAICLCDEYSLFAGVIKRLLPNVAFLSENQAESKLKNDCFFIDPYCKAENFPENCGHCNIASYLGLDKKSTEHLLSLMYGAQAEKNNLPPDEYTYLKEAYAAVEDFTNDFLNYMKKSKDNFTISGDNAARLYMCGDPQIQR